MAALEDWIEAYRRFLEGHPPRRVQGVEVFALGEGPALLFPHGMAGDGSARWRLPVHLQDRFRVLAPTDPDPEHPFDLAKRIPDALEATC